MHPLAVRGLPLRAGAVHYVREDTAQPGIGIDEVDDGDLLATTQPTLELGPPS